LELGKNFIRRFFIDLHHSYIRKSIAVNSNLKDINVFIEYLINNNEVPFTKADIHRYLREIQDIMSDSCEIEDKTLRLFDIVSEFHAKLDCFIH